jgi:hypothetical protein
MWIRDIWSSVASCAGQLKKLLAPRTGLQPADQQLSYRGRARGNAEYLDACGVKNKSKVALAEDPASVERRYIERQRNARAESANRAIGAVALEVDKLADQVRDEARESGGRCVVVFGGTVGVGGSQASKQASMGGAIELVQYSTW